MTRKKEADHVNHERWLVSYADFITLLFAFFVVMFSVSRVDSGKVGRFSNSFAEAMGLPLGNAGGQGMLPGPGAPPPSAGVAEPPPGAELQVAESRLRSHLRGPDLEKVVILRRGNELVLRFTEAVSFGSGDDTLKEPAVRAMRAIADELRARRVSIRVEGHTDDVPIKNARFRSNWELSTARATAVVAELVDPGSVPPVRLSAAGYGEFHPVASNDTPEHRSLNRRVDIVVTEMSEAVPLAERADKPAP